MALQSKAIAKAAIAGLQSVPQTGRVMRKPSHSFHLRTRPNQIQPFYLAPVQPGETLKNLLVQARVLADPVENPLIGWWNEMYFFYVKLTDLDIAEQLKAMLVTNTGQGALVAAADTAMYHSANGINYTREALNVITKHYFRDEDETVLQGAIDGLPLARSDGPGWLDSAKYGSLAGESLHEFPGENTVIPPNMSAYANYYTQWEAMRSLSLTTADFEDYLKTFGIDVPREDNEDRRKPELLRYVRSWAYPTATTKSDGSSGAAPQWSIAERADKDRFFKEPGFIVGVQVTRPKVYMSSQTGSLAHWMNGSTEWLPAIMSGEPYTGLKEFTPAFGPLSGTASENYWVDLRDLMTYGDQFINFDRVATDYGQVALPTASMNKRYISPADADGLFAAPAFNKIRSDGVVTSSILGRIVDTTL